MHAAALFAQDVPEGASSALPIAIAAFLAMFVVFLGMAVLMVKQYKRCPPNRIMVVFGKAGLGARPSVFTGVPD